MIKFIAALFMLVDHIGMILFPQVYVLRILGRLSMPLFAYSVARGFYYSNKKGTTARYARNLFLFALISQIPFTVLSVWINGAFALNIGFTWLLAVCLMKTLSTEKRPIALGVMCALIFLIALVIPVDYGLCGVIYPSVYFLLLFGYYKPQYVFVSTAALYALYVITGGGQIQAFSIAAFPILMIAKQRDDKIKMPRRFYYWFYPLHIAVLLGIKALL